MGDLHISGKLAARIRRKAEEEGLSVEALLEKYLEPEFRRLGLIPAAPLNTELEFPASQSEDEIPKP